MSEPFTFTLLDGNMQLPRRKLSAKTMKARTDLIGDAKPDLLTLQETTAQFRDEVARLFGMKCWENGTQGVLWRIAKFASGPKPRRLAFRTVHDGTVTNGAVLAPLYPIGASVPGIDVTCVHVQSTSTGASAASKVKQIQKVAALGGRWPQLVAGDFNHESPELYLPRLHRVTPKVPTQDGAGGVGHKGGKIDHVFQLGLTVHSTRLLDTGNIADHSWWVAEFVIPGIIPTN